MPNTKDNPEISNETKSDATKEELTTYGDDFTDPLDNATNKMGTERLDKGKITPSNIREALKSLLKKPYNKENFKILTEILTTARDAQKNKPATWKPFAYIWRERWNAWLITDTQPQNCNIDSVISALKKCAETPESSKDFQEAIIELAYTLGISDERLRNEARKHNEEMQKVIDKHHIPSERIAVLRWTPIYNQWKNNPEYLIAKCKKLNIPAKFNNDSTITIGPTTWNPNTDAIKDAFLTAYEYQVIRNTFNFKSDQ